MRETITILLLLISVPLSAQDTIPVKKFQYKGYIKDLQTLNFQNNFKNLTTGNLIHNRFNLRWEPTPKFTAAAEFRNRLFWGEDVRLTPGFSSHLRNANEAFNLTRSWINTGSMVLNTTIDRIWVEYRGTKWNARAGRQRINWGIGTTWNPNDLFNTYNFLDFDYEERPGADAVRLQYFTGLMDHIEFATSFAKGNDDIIAAVRYFKNIADYDLQFIAASFHNQPTIGMGWSGSISQAGFKGEIQYYFKGRGSYEQLNVVLEADYVFDNGWYVGAGTLYNSRGTTQSTASWELASLRFSPQSLMPTKWNAMLALNKEITPLLSANTTLIYAPFTNLVLFLPSLTYSLTDNLDFSLVWQSFLSEQPNGFDDLSHRCFLRFKWSY